MSEPLQTLFANRFGVFESVRNDVWKVLTRYFFQKWARPTDVVLDLGAGYCEFINNIYAGKKYALDLNLATLLQGAIGCNCDFAGCVNSMATAKRFGRRGVYQ